MVVGDSFSRALSLLPVPPRGMIEVEGEGKMLELSDNDVKILKYIRRHGQAAVEDLERALPDVASVAYRVKVLSTPEYKYVSTVRLALENTSFIEQDYTVVTDAETHTSHHEPLGIYRLTEFGLKALQDHECTAKTSRRELWLKNAWIPIIVAFVTTLLANYMLPRLLHMIESWASTL